jgi:hypothetical protein
LIPRKVQTYFSRVVLPLNRWQSQSFQGGNYLAKTLARAFADGGTRRVQK